MKLKEKVKNLVKGLPYVKDHFQRYKSLQEEWSAFQQNSAFPPGHFYSPIVSVKEIKSKEAEIWKNKQVNEIEGIELNVQEQIELVSAFAEYYAELPFDEQNAGNRRFYFQNDYFSYTESIMLYSMIRHFKPKRIIEVGSGFTSAVMLDTNELFFSNSIKLTFIEPYPDRLNSLLHEKDRQITTIIERGVQAVSPDFFRALDEGDILFVDSTHVAKTGSDVNYLIFEVLPKLKSGVFVHFHDIFYPFEYPKEWVLRGRNWNEDYFIRAFLMYNSEFKIKLFTDYLHQHQSEAFAQLPLCYKNHGSSLWLMKK